MKPISQKRNNSAFEDCRSIRAVLEDSEQKVELGSKIAAHFEHCRSCCLYSEQLMRLRNLLASQPQVQAPADFDVKLRRRIVEANSAKPAFWRFVMQPVGAMATAAAIIGLAATMTLTRFVQKPGHLEGPRSTSSVSSEYSAESAGSVGSNPVAAIRNPKSSNPDIAEDESAAGREAFAVRSSPDSAIAAAKSVRGGREIKEIRYASGLSKPNEAGDDVIVVIQDRSKRSHSVPIKMVTYGSQPVVNLGALVSPVEIEESLTSDDESRIF